MQLTVSSDGKINGRLGTIFQVTLDGTNGTLKFLNFTKGDTFTLLLKQDSTGSRTATFPSGVTWQSGQAPSLQTAAGVTDAFTFVCNGSNTFTDASGAPNRLPARIGLAALGTIVGVILGSTGQAVITHNLSAGSGAPSEITAVSDVEQVKVGTGTNATTVSRRTGSGDIMLTASGGNNGGLAVGVPNLKSTSKITAANLYVNKEGELTGSSARVRGALSGASLRLNGASSGKLLCFIGNTNVVGKCSAAVYGTGVCNCQ